jgi:hypothetical protein
MLSPSLSLSLSLEPNRLTLNKLESESESESEVLGRPFHWHFCSGTFRFYFLVAPLDESEPQSFPKGIGEGVSYWILVAKAKLEASLILNRSEPCPLKAV